MRFGCGGGSGSGSYNAGPGLAVEFSVCFDNPSQANHYYFAFKNVYPGLVGGKFTELLVYRVYKLPNISIKPTVSPTLIPSPDAITATPIATSADTGGDDGPVGYTFCADENQRCNFSGTKDVAYGAQNMFNYKHGVSDGIECNNDTFGDPIYGATKACYVTLGPSATLLPGTSVGDWAELAQQSEYFVVYPDDPIRPYVIVRNAGSNTWKADIYGFSGRGAWVDRLGNGKLWRDVEPGDTIEFVNEKEIKTPSKPGTYDYGFMLVNDKGNEFGPYFFIRVDVVSRPENAGAGELRLLGKLPVDPLKYKLNQQLSPAGYLDLLVVHSGRVFAKLYEVLQALRTGGRIFSTSPTRSKLRSMKM